MNNINRRALLGKCAVVVPAVSVAAVASSAAPASASSSSSAAATDGHTVVGTWTAVVTIPSDTSIPPEPGIFAFGADGIVSGVSGGNVVGFGTWQTTGRSSFAIDFRHFITDSSGNIVGDVRVRQQGTLQSSTQFVSDGPAMEYDMNGNLLATQQSNTVGTRYGFG